MSVSVMYLLVGGEEQKETVVDKNKRGNWLWTMGVGNYLTGWEINQPLIHQGATSYDDIYVIKLVGVSCCSFYVRYPSEWSNKYVCIRGEIA